MEFDVYNYQCGALSDDQAFSAEDAPVKKEHLELIDRILTADKLDYPATSRMGVPFKEDELLRLIRKRVRRRTRVSNPMQAEQTWPYLKALICYAREGFYVMRVQNQTLFSEEDEWEEDDDFNGASCWVILANISDRQLLLVEANSAFDATISRSTQIVADIFEDTFKALLVPSQLDVHFCPLDRSGKVCAAMRKEDDSQIYNKAADIEIISSRFKVIDVFKLQINRSQEASFQELAKKAINKVIEDPQFSAQVLDLLKVLVANVLTSQKSGS